MMFEFCPGLLQEGILGRMLAFSLDVTFDFNLYGLGYSLLSHWQCTEGEAEALGVVLGPLMILEGNMIGHMVCHLLASSCCG